MFKEIGNRVNNFVGDLKLEAELLYSRVEGGHGLSYRRSELLEEHLKYRKLHPGTSKFGFLRAARTNPEQVIAEIGEKVRVHDLFGPSYDYTRCEIVDYVALQMENKKKEFPYGNRIHLVTGGLTVRVIKDHTE